MPHGTHASGAEPGRAGVTENGHGSTVRSTQARASPSANGHPGCTAAGREVFASASASSDHVSLGTGRLARLAPGLAWQNVHSRTTFLAASGLLPQTAAKGSQAAAGGHVNSAVLHAQAELSFASGPGPGGVSQGQVDPALAPEQKSARVRTRSLARRQVRSRKIVFQRGTSRELQVALFCSLLIFRHPSASSSPSHPRRFVLLATSDTRHTKRGVHSLSLPSLLPAPCNDPLC